MKRIIIWALAALVALPALAQQFAQQDQNLKAATPEAVFQSTSTMTPSGSSYSANPMLNQDGTAYNPVAAAENTSAAKAGRGVKRDGLPSTPNTEGEQDNTPLGDAVLPLMLMALAYCGIVYYRRKRAVKR